MYAGTPPRLRIPTIVNTDSDDGERPPERLLRRLLQTAVGMTQKKSAEGPPYSFPQLWQFPQAGARYRPHRRRARRFL